MTMTASTITLEHAPVQYVHSRVTVYHSARVDLRWRRAIHSCQICELIPLGDHIQKCGAVHHGYCTSVVAVPARLLAKAVTAAARDGKAKIAKGFITKGTVTIPTIPANAARIVTNHKSSAAPKLRVVSQAPKEEFAVRSTEVHKGGRGEPDGESNSFLRQKEAQLREKRERERQQKEFEREKEEKKLKEKEIEEKRIKEKTHEKGDNIVNEEQPADTSKLLKSIENKAKKKDISDAVTKDLPEPVTDSQHNKSGHVKSKETTKAVSAPELPIKDSAAHIPTFYFPMGQPGGGDNSSTVIQKIKDAFSKLESGKADKISIGNIAKASGLSFYWRSLLWSLCGGEKSGHVTLQQYLAMWKKLCATCHDPAAKFMRMMARGGATYLVSDDFVPLIQDVVDAHPGLTFLQDAPEFHSRYVNTVIARIFYCVNRSWTGRITLPEIRRSNFLQTLQLLEEEDDINQVTDFFSYEHFYVIYCKFWELDKDHDLFISREDLARHNDHAISQRMIDRVFSGAVTRGKAQKEGRMSYMDFVWFLISEEDKRSPTSIEYWFRCMDLDGDGIISMYEMEYFYEEMVQRMEAMGIETLPFEDCLCQMLDMVKPIQEGRITLADLKACKMSPLFFDTFFNLEKYLEHEQKDPFANIRDPDEPEMSDWERYAAEEYEILVAEEGNNDGGNDEIAYEDDFEPDEEGSTTPEPVIDVVERPDDKKAEDDIYDFTNQNLGY